MATTFLILGVLGLALTAHAWRPIRAPSSVAVVSFFVSWPTTELALHLAACLAVVAVAAIATGAVLSWPGAIGGACATLSCAGLVALHRRGALAADVIDRALRDGIGDAFEERLTDDARAWVGSAFAWRRILLPFSHRVAGVETVRGIPFARVGGKTLELDVHRPRVRRDGAPTLVYVHGGGWVLGFRRYQGLPLMRHLAARGWVCFSIDYRLSPSAKFPDHLIDVKRGLAWVRDHAAEHGADPSFLVLCGNSAGAHLSALAALTPNDPRYQPGFEETDTSVSACIGLYGIYDFNDRHGHWPHRGFDWLLESVVMKSPRATSPDLYAEASPIDRIGEGAPPFLLVHGAHDTLAPPRESRHFAAALRARSKAPVVHIEIPDAQHAFEIFSSPRAAHFVTGATSFVAHVYSAHLEAERARATAAGERPRSGLVAKGEAREPGDGSSDAASVA